MANASRSCLLALLLALVPVPVAHAAGHPAHHTPDALPLVGNPARLPGSIPLTPVARPRPAPTLGERAALIARRELGVPYRYGGSSPSGFDCSGLTSWVYARLGISLPHNAAAQYGYGRPVSEDRLRPGDLVFFHGLGHVGIYIGGGRIIHAPQSGERVSIQSLSVRSGSVDGARRVA